MLRPLTWIWLPYQSAGCVTEVQVVTRLDPTRPGSPTLENWGDSSLDLSSTMWIVFLLSPRTGCDTCRVPSSPCACSVTNSTATRPRPRESPSWVPRTSRSWTSRRSSSKSLRRSTTLSSRRNHWSSRFLGSSDPGWIKPGSSRRFLLIRMTCRPRSMISRRPSSSRWKRCVSQNHKFTYPRA